MVTKKKKTDLELLSRACFVDDTWLIPYLELHFHTELKSDQVLYQSSQEKCAVTATAIVVLIFSPSGPSLKQHHRICTLEPILDGQLGSSFDSAT